MPKSVRVFERMMFVSLVLGVATSSMNYDAGVRRVGPVFVVLASVLVAALLMGLVLLISRGKNRIAKWVLVAMFLAGLPLYVPKLGAWLSHGPVGLISLTQLILQGVALWFLFRPDANVWFSRPKHLANAAG